MAKRRLQEESEKTGECEACLMGYCEDCEYPDECKCKNPHQSPCGVPVGVDHPDPCIHCWSECAGPDY